MSDTAMRDQETARLAEHAAAVEHLTAEAERSLLAGDHDQTAAMVQAAAQTAWMRHAGIHASTRLERLVWLLGKQLGDARGPRLRADGRDRMLHVLSVALPSGGHTRLVERVVRADASRAHSCVIVDQGGQPVPTWLDEAVRASGGAIHVLESRTALERASGLRDLARQADAIVAYQHPHDVITLAALCQLGLPPVAMLNHADHAFWLGATLPGLLVNLRQAGADLAARRRGIAPERSTILPAPVAAPVARVARDEARRLLGIGDGDVLLVSVSSAWKFDPRGAVGGASFLDILTPIVARDRRLRLIAFGPIPAGPWADAARQTGGRLQAMGTRPDVSLYEQAADIYLDSFPAGSTYGVLEAALFGVPVLSMSAWPPGVEVLSVDSPGLGDARFVARTRAAYEAELERLIGDPAARRDSGARLAEQVAAVHTGDGWRARLEQTLAKVVASPQAVPSLPATVDLPSAGDLDRALIRLEMLQVAPPDHVVIRVPLGSAPTEPSVRPDDRAAMLRSSEAADA